MNICIKRSSLLLLIVGLLFTSCSLKEIKSESNEGTEEIVNNEGLGEIVNNKGTEEIVNNEGPEEVVYNERTEEIIYSEGPEKIVDNSNKFDCLLPTEAKTYFKGKNLKQAGELWIEKNRQGPDWDIYQSYVDKETDGATRKLEEKWLKECLGLSF